MNNTELDGYNSASITKAKPVIGPKHSLSKSTRGMKPLGVVTDDEGVMRLRRDHGDKS